jgi:hypothetical protein
MQSKTPIPDDIKRIATEIVDAAFKDGIKRMAL